MALLLAVTLLGSGCSGIYSKGWVAIAQLDEGTVPAEVSSHLDDSWLSAKVQDVEVRLSVTNGCWNLLRSGPTFLPLVPQGADHCRDITSMEDPPGLRVRLAFQRDLDARDEVEIDLRKCILRVVERSLAPSLVRVVFFQPFSVLEPEVDLHRFVLGPGDYTIHLTFPVETPELDGGATLELPPIRLGEETIRLPKTALTVRHDRRYTPWGIHIGRGFW